MTCPPVVRTYGATHRRDAEVFPFPFRIGGYGGVSPCLSVSLAFYILCVRRVSAVKKRQVISGRPGGAPRPALACFASERS